MSSSLPEAHKAASRHIKVITIDDEASIRHLIRHTLRRDNYEVVEARNGREGLTAIRREMPDLILLDVVMPDMSGLEALHLIRTDGAIAHIPVLLLSGFKDTEKLGKALEQPHTDFLPKPFLLEELRARVRSLICDSLPLV
ncbi:response regulator [candidate division KSB1 bacterium]|nr:response regulator [candidate division KSB1 bacterium]